MSIVRKFSKGIKYICDSDYRFLINSIHGRYNSMPDEEFLKGKYKAVMGKRLNLSEPQAFNEKLQWLKLYDRKPEYTVMADKYLVRDYIAEKLGEEYLIPLIGVWDSAEDIDFDALPDKFVLKCNHNSGTGMCICRDKSKLDIKKVKSELRKGLEQDYYITNREWPYKNIPRRIICEKYMEDSGSSNGVKGLTDYKFYCFNGKALYLYVSQGLENHETARISFLNMDWTFADFGRTDYKSLEKLPPKPENYEKMIKIAEKLSEGCAFLRVDLYEINSRIYFGELTFSPCAGMMKFVPEEWDYKLGEYIRLPEKNV